MAWDISRHMELVGKAEQGQSPIDWRKYDQYLLQAQGVRDPESRSMLVNQLRYAQEKALDKQVSNIQSTSQPPAAIPEGSPASLTPETSGDVAPAVPEMQAAPEIRDVEQGSQNILQKVLAKILKTRAEQPVEDREQAIQNAARAGK